MLALPSLAGIPPAIQAASLNSTAARMALEILPRRAPFTPPKRSGSFEVRVLEQLVRDRLHDKIEDLAALGVFDIRIDLHTSVDIASWELPTTAPADRCAIVMMSNRSGNYLDGAWTLERRWKQIEARAPGLAASALHTLDQANRHGLSLYTPEAAHYYCSYMQWQGENDERYALENYFDDASDLSDDEIEEKAHDAGLWTRKAFDRAIPPEVHTPKCLPAAQLARLARGRGETAEIAKAVVALRARMRNLRGKRSDPHMESGYNAEPLAFGYGAAVRWNRDDPALEFFDDYGQAHGQDGAVEPVHGYYLYEPGKLDRILQLIAQRVTVAGPASDLLHMIATRVAR